MIDATSPEAIAAVSATWLGVRMAKPWLQAVPRFGPWFVSHPQRMWSLVFVSAFGVSALNTLAGDASLDIAVQAQEAVAITLAALGVDRVIKGSGTE